MRFYLGNWTLLKCQKGHEQKGAKKDDIEGIKGFLEEGA
jgi:hypothetical protein